MFNLDHSILGKVAGLPSMTSNYQNRGSVLPVTEASIALL